MSYTGSSILIVDDEPGIRDLHKDILEEEGFLCHLASGGEDALTVLATHGVDLVLMDIIMPGMTGLSLFQRVSELYPDISVIFVTALNDLDLVVEHLKNGAYDYIVKPVRRKRLLQAVGDALHRRSVGLEDILHRRHLEELVTHQAKALRRKMTSQ